MFDGSKVKTVDRSKVNKVFSPEAFEEATRVRNSLRKWEPDGAEATRTTNQEPVPAPVHAAPLQLDVVERNPVLDLLDSLPLGAAVAAFVSTLDRARLVGHELVTLLAAESRLISHLQAGMYQTMGELSSRPGMDDPETAASEVAASLRLTRQASAIERELAMGMARHPQVMAALRSGVIDLRRARVIIGNLQGLDTATADVVLDRVLPHATNLTTGQLAARLRRLVMTADATGASTRYHAALEDRRVVIYDNPDGTAGLYAVNLPPDRLLGFRDRLEDVARSSATPGDTRSADQIRADVFMDLLENLVTGGQGKAFVNIDVELTTLMGIDDHPGTIPGWGPIAAEIAREVVDRQVDSTWEYTVLDQGRPVATGTLSRRPQEGMRRRIRSRTPSCIHPGCRVPARRADIDHTREWAINGTTTLDNLAPLCEHHHQLKDRGWTYRRRDDGAFEFTSPLGHTYVTSGRSP